MDGVKVILASSLCAVPGTVPTALSHFPRRTMTLRDIKWFAQGSKAKWETHYLNPICLAPALLTATDRWKMRAQPREESPCRCVAPPERTLGVMTLSWCSQCPFMLHIPSSVMRPLYVVPLVLFLTLLFLLWLAHPPGLASAAMLTPDI